MIVAGGLDTIPGLGFGPACAPVELGSDRCFFVLICVILKTIIHHLHQVLQRDGGSNPDLEHNTVWPR